MLILLRVVRLCSVCQESLVEGQRVLNIIAVIAIIAVSAGRNSHRKLLGERDISLGGRLDDQPVSYIMLFLHQKLQYYNYEQASTYPKA